jgi:hypothetical protein
MSSVKRRLFNALTGISLLLSVVTIIAWVWSDLRPETPHSLLDVRNVNIFATQGHFGFEGPPDSPQAWIIQSPFSTTNRVGTGPSIILFRCWKVLLALLILPAIWFVVRCRSNPGVSGLCAKCGYDLRATLDRCPECGTILSKPIEAKS